MFTIDRTVEYEGTKYRIVAFLDSGHLLVIPNDAKFPCSPVVIPGE